MSDEEMSTLLASFERSLAGSWSDIVTALQDDNSVEVIEERLRSGYAVHSVAGVEDAASTFAADVHAAYTRSGQATARSLDGQLDAVIRFDGTNPRALAWAQQNKLDLVREITNEQRDVLRRVLADGVNAGRNPLEVAREMRNSIGLTDYQAQIVENYRRSLESGDFVSALDRELRDGRYDRSLATAIRDDRALPQEQIDRMVDAYRRGWVSFRAETIARTEGLRALHEGNEELYRQAIAAGDLKASQLECEWHHAYVGKFPREDHAVMNGQRRPFGEPFESGSGVMLRYPGDPDAPASEVIGCKCVKSTVLA